MMSKISRRGSIFQKIPRERKKEAVGELSQYRIIDLVFLLVLVFFLFPYNIFDFYKNRYIPFYIKVMNIQNIYEIKMRMTTIKFFFVVEIFVQIFFIYRENLNLHNIYEI